MQKNTKPQENGIIIVGAGHAGVECAWALRAAGYEGRVRLIGSERHQPYHRPPLSKAFLAGDTSLERVVLRADSGYASLGIELELGRTVSRLDIEKRCLEMVDGGVATFDKCVIATGARARVLPGLDGPCVYYIRSLDHALELQKEIRPGVRLLVLGGGYLGLEVASTATKSGAVVTVLEQGSSIMPGRVSSHTTEKFDAMHRGAGVTLVKDQVIREWAHADEGWRISVDGGASFAADVVLVAIGAQPNIELAQAAGLRCNAGIVVDDNCETSASGIYAIGDCASSYRAALGQYARIESVQNALDQAKVAAAAIAGATRPNSRPATFWSEQHGRRLQMAGLVDSTKACHETVLSTPKGWIVERYQDGVLKGLEAIDSPAEFIKNVNRIGQTVDLSPDSFNKKEESHANGQFSAGER